MNIQHILVPTDFSSFSDLAIQNASFLREKFEARITLLHVLTPLEADALVSQPGNPWENVVLRIRNEMAKEVERNATSSIPEGQLDLEVVVGEPAEEIVRFARENKVDLIVMGTHGRTGLASVFLGSITVGVIKRTCIPVMVVKCPEEQQ